MSGNVQIPVDHKDACAHCKGLLRNALQTEEGQRVCEECFAKIKLNAKRKTYRFFVLIRLLLALIQLSYFGSRATKCPDCSINASSKCYKDHAARREVLTAKVYCSRRNFGCSWKGLSHHLKKHEAICRFHSPGPPIFGGNGACIKLCAHCKHVPVDAVQTENGEILCMECFSGIMDCPNRHCDECNVAVERDKYHIDKAVRREVNSYSAKCHWKEWGCTWIGTPREYEAHLQKCRFMKILPCCHDGCSFSLPMALLDEHKVKCKFRPVRCSECRCEVPFYQLAKHYRGQCKAARIACVPSPARFKQLVENEGGEIVMPTFKVPRMEYIDPINTLQPAVPERKISVAIRAHKLVEVELLITEGYVKDDRLFIKCIVDTTNTFHH